MKYLIRKRSLLSNKCEREGIIEEFITSLCTAKMAPLPHADALYRALTDTKLFVLRRYHVAFDSACHCSPYIKGDSFWDIDEQPSTKCHGTIKRNSICASMFDKEITELLTKCGIPVKRILEVSGKTNLDIQD